MFKSSKAKYESEIEYSWDHYFGLKLFTLLEHKLVLDLGCFTGGRSSAWFERYNLNKLFGIDVDQVFIDSATQFANFKKINAEFKVAKGEDLPFTDGKFDAVLSFDVFEHVQNIWKTLDECWRVLRPNGKLFVVFPGYFHPFEHHLSFATRMPFFHYFFNSRTLINAYCAVLDERGHDAYWYKRDSSKPESWERSNTINGTTLKQFKKLIKNKDWKIVMQGNKPIGSVGRNMAKKPLVLLASKSFYPLIFIPGIQEIFLHRITFILEKIE